MKRVRKTKLEHQYLQGWAQSGGGVPRGQRGGVLKSQKKVIKGAEMRQGCLRIKVGRYSALRNKRRKGGKKRLVEKREAGVRIMGKRKASRK